MEHKEIDVLADMFNRINFFLPPQPPQLSGQINFSHLPFFDIKTCYIKRANWNQNHVKGRNKKSLRVMV